MASSLTLPRLSTISVASVFAPPTSPSKWESNNASGAGVASRRSYLLSFPTSHPSSGQDCCLTVGCMSSQSSKKGVAVKAKHGDYIVRDILIDAFMGQSSSVVMVAAAMARITRTCVRRMRTSGCCRCRHQRRTICGCFGPHRGSCLARRPR